MKVTGCICIVVLAALLSDYSTTLAEDERSPGTAGEFTAVADTQWAGERSFVPIQDSRNDSRDVIPIDDIQYYNPDTGEPESPYEDQEVTVEGIVYVPRGTYSPGGYYIQGSTGGINTWDNAGPDYAIGDRVEITGLVWYSSADEEIYIGNPVFEFVSHETEPYPNRVPIEELVTDYEHVGSFVMAVGIVADKTDNQFFLVEDSGTIRVTIDADTGVDISEVNDGDLYRVQSPCLITTREIWLSPRIQSDLLENPPLSPYLVNPDGTGDFPTIQAAINAAVAGEVVELSDGIFTGDGNRDIDFLGKAITVQSQSGNPELCIIDCEAEESNMHRGFLFHSGETNSAVLSSLTITNGWFEGDPRIRGGAILCEEGSSPSLLGCIFSNNHADLGGGVYIIDSTPVIGDCRFIQNTAYGGGGLMLHNAPISLTNCVFDSNEARYGGGMHFNIGSNALVTYCTFEANESYMTGGGMYIHEASPQVQYTVFNGNFGVYAEL